MPEPQLTICFATMAVGKEYLQVAQLLASDVSLFCPGVPIFVLTNEESFAKGNSQVQIVPFRNAGYWFIYHGKIQAVRAAIAKFDICIFIDADCRLLAPPPFGALSHLPAGVYGAYAQTFEYKFTGDQAMFLERGGTERLLRNTPRRRRDVYKAIGKPLGINTPDCKFLHEACLVFVKDERTPNLLNAWEYLGKASSARLLEWGEGCTLGMSADLVRANVGVVPDLSSWLFKDLLLSAEQREDPVLATLLNERLSKRVSKSNSGSSRLKRFLIGLFRFAAHAPWWLLRGEAIELSNVKRSMSA